MIIFPCVCSRDMLQLFDKALIGFLLEICFKYTLNAFMTVKHVCVCQNRDSNRNRKIDQRNRDSFFCPYRTASTAIVCSAETASPEVAYALSAMCAVRRQGLDGRVAHAFKEADEGQRSRL